MQITSTFHRYFFSRFFKYLIAINLFFVFLFNFIEFFEKLLRAQHSSVSDILYFLFLNIAPTFFEQLPVSAWLASGLLIRELYQQQELDALLLMSFNFRQLFTLFFTAGLVLAMTSFVLNEYFVTNITFKAEQYKMEQFKQISTQKLISKWMALEQNTFCYFSVLDFQAKTGQDLFIVFITPQYTIQKTISAPAFSIDAQQQRIIIPEGKIFDVEQNLHSKINNYSFTNPSFFSQIYIHHEPPSAINLIKTLVRGHNVIPHTLSNDLLGQLLKRLIAYLLLILYPMLTLGLFALFWRNQTFRWIALLLPYPLFTLASMLTDYMIHHGINAGVSYGPYLIIIGGIAAIYCFLK